MELSIVLIVRNIGIQLSSGKRKKINKENKMKYYTTHNSVESAADTIKLVDKETDLNPIGYVIKKRGKRLYDLYLIEEGDQIPGTI